MRRSVRTWRESTGYIQGETTETTLSCVRGVQEPEWLQTKNVMADACLFIYSFEEKIKFTLSVTTTTGTATAGGEMIVYQVARQ